MRRKKASKPVSEVSIEALAKAMLDLHSCKAMWVESVPVKEVFEGKTIWEGIVQVFEVDHSKSRLCYAWSHELEGSPEKAVRAAIVRDQPYHGNQEEII
jgi:hypothetical protein